MLFSLVAYIRFEGSGNHGTMRSLKMAPGGKRMKFPSKVDVANECSTVKNTSLYRRVAQVATDKALTHGNHLSEELQSLELSLPVVAMH